MVVSFSIGAKSKTVINTLKKTADNVDFLSFADLKTLVKEAKLRHIDFKRVIFTSAILSNIREDLEELNSFISEYSANTEVVIIIMQNDAEIAGIFNSIFDAPMYTPVILPKANSKNLLELVFSDIVELKTKYYTFDKGSLVGEPLNSEETDFTVNSSDNFSSYTSSMETESKLSTFGKTVVDESVYQDLHTSSDESVEFDSDLSLGTLGCTENLSTFSNVSAIGGVSQLTAEDSMVGNLEDDLSIGEFGSLHSDTGFLDEEGEAMLGGKPDVTYIEKGNANLENRTFSQPVKVEKLENRTDKVAIPLKVDLVTSLRGNGSTNAILEEAVNIVSVDDAKVLVIDLDNKENGILSYIDADKFYNKCANDGIAKQRIYSEDGVDIISNGYGSLVTTRQIKDLLQSQIVRGYDMIFMDCPIDSLYLLDAGLLGIVNILVMSNIDRSQLIATSIALTNRTLVSLEVEQHIMNYCNVELIGTYNQTEIDYVRSHCLFANGCWLDKLSQGKI